MAEPNAQYLQNQILIHSLRAKYWMVRAATEEEPRKAAKIKEDLEVAANHIHLIQEMNDYLYKLLEGGI